MASPPVDPVGESPAPVASPVLLSARTATFTASMQFVARGVSALMAVAITAVVTRSVAVATYADWATAATVVTMLSFVMDPGISPVVVRRLIQRPESCPTLRSLLLLRGSLAVAGAAVSVAVVVALRGIDAALVAAVLAAQLLPRAAVLNAGALLQADHRLHRQAFLEVGTGAAGLAALVVAASLDAGAPVLALVGITLPIALLAALVSRAAARTPGAARITPGDDRERVRSIAREIAPLALALLLVSMYTRIQVVFVNAGESAGRVAEYLLAFQVVEQLLVVAAILGATLLPFLADRARERELHGDELTQTVLLGLATLGTVTASGMLLLAEPVMRLLGGARLAGASGFLLLLAPMASVLFVAVTLSYVYAAMGRGARYLRFNVIGLVAALALNAALTLPLGAEAAARITWGVEFLVVAMALRAVAASGSAGSARVGRLAGLGALAVAGSELAHDGVVAPALAAALVLAGAVALGGTAVRTLVVTRLRPARA